MESPERIPWKRILKCGISLGVFAFSTIRAFLVRLAGKTPQGSCIILYYHSIPPEHRAEFAHQLDLLLRIARPIAITGEVMLNPGARNVGITFDDALENVVTCALPELKGRGIPSTIFVISEAIGKNFGAPGCLEKVMTLEQLRKLPDDLVTIGSHTSTHPFLPSLSKEDARRELTQSRVELKKILDREIPLFSFPFGGFTEELVALCHEAGYQRVFTTLPKFAFKHADEFVVGRVRVDPTDWPLEYRLKLAGAYRWLPLAFAFKQKILSHVVLGRMFGLKRPLMGPRVPIAVIRESGGQ
jgi:peptidoglycan/xylan/chitin deacetylase (PgdA/CDA1 family)